MKISALLLGLSSFSALGAALPQSLDLSKYTTKRADSNLVGYLGAFFLGGTENVYFYLSNGNSPTQFTALNGGNPVLVPTIGTKGVRDPFVVAGGGSEAGQKWYIVGTDLRIGGTTWDAAQRNGSKSIFVWESTDLTTWTKQRLVKVEDSTAGMVWAPEALWDSSNSQYFVYWSSKFYDSSDTSHAGTPSATRIRYAYTSDFSTFTSPADWINYSPSSVIDADILPLGGESYVRFVKNETSPAVFTEISTDGLFGSWSRPGGATANIRTGVEGPASYWDNEVSGKAHLLLDFYSGDGYAPFESTDPAAGASTWSASDASGFPSNLRHGSVLPINQTLYDSLNAAY